MLINDFSAGWCPSDDAIKGRKNGLLRMSNVELDRNGVLTLVNGTKRIGTVYSSVPHSIFSKYIGSTNYYYAGAANGKVYRNATEIGTGGSASVAAFGSIYDSVLAFSGAVRIRDTGAATKNLGRQTPTVAPTVASAGAGVLNGDYEYCQIFVYSAGAWQGKSARSAISTITLANQNTTVTAQSPAGIDTEANEVWIFRRGGNLDEFYRVKKLTSAYATPFTDSLSDDDALTLGITLNEYLAAVNSTGLTDTIIDCEGPIYNRMLLFSATTIYLTETNSPDSYDTRTPIGICAASGSEKFLFATKLGENTCVVATTKDLYILTGTFVQLPDGTLDVALRPLSVQNPPISAQSCKYRNAIVYMSKAGWAIVNLDGNENDLAGINTDAIYRGITCHTLGGVPVSFSESYHCAIGQNKLYCRVPVIVGDNPATAFTYRLEVFDFLRKAWHTQPLATTTAFSILSSTEDGKVFAYHGTDTYLHQLDYVYSKTIDGGSQTKQDIDLLFPFIDEDAPFRRKTTNALKVRCLTGGDTVTVKYAKDGAVALTTLGTISSATLTDAVFDISGIGPCVNLQVAISSAAGLADFRLVDIETLWDAHPEQLSYKKFDFVELGLENGHKKRVRSLSFLIDTLGQDITFTPIVDGTSLTTSIVNTTGRRIHTHYFTTDVFGTDFTGKLSSSAGLKFEFWRALQPGIVQVLPLGLKFDQIGPQEFLRYGKIQGIQIRLLAFGGTAIPYKLYIEDVEIGTGVITVVDGYDSSYEIPVPKTVAGEILRLTLGPTTFPFHRLSTFVKAIQTGRDKDVPWIEIPAGNGR